MFSQQDPHLANALVLNLLQQEEERKAKEKRLRDAAELAKKQPFKRYKLTSKRLHPEVKPAAADPMVVEQKPEPDLPPGFRLLADVKPNDSVEEAPLLEPIEPKDAAPPAVKSPGLHFFVFGCHGNGKENQAAVARLMEQIIAQNPDQRPDFILILGDNFYDSGVANAEDPAFKTHFDNVYKKFKELNIPTFSILGNHDLDYHSAHVPGTKQGMAVGQHQIDHSYLNGNPYADDTLNLDQLPLWNMPSEAYSLYHDDMEIICIDSNTYVKDYLAFLSGKDISENNQAVWVQKTVAEAKKAGRKVQLALHHPWETEGKRRFKADASMYLTEAQRNQFRELVNHLPHLSPYNDYVKATFEHQELQFDAIFAAHDHHQTFIKKADGSTHITAGGGGGDTQPRRAFRDQNEMGVFLREHGFVSVKNDENDPRALNFQFHTVKNPDAVYEFTNQSIKPIREYPNNLAPAEVQQIQQMEKLVRETINEYLNFLGRQQETAKGKFITLNLFKGNISHGTEGIDRAHRLWAYMSQKKADTYLTTLETIKDITDWTGKITSPRPHSLTILLENKLKTALNKTLNQLIADASAANIHELVNEEEVIPLHGRVAAEGASSLTMFLKKESTKLSGSCADDVTSSQHMTVDCSA